MAPKPVLVKVGGSLLTLPDLDRRLNRLCDLLSGPLLMLAGGGAVVDVVRDWSRTHQLSDSAAHWLAIDALSLTARLLATRLPGSVLAASRDEVQRGHAAGRTVVIEPRPLLEQFQSEASETLPAGWHVTSDSIAAWLAIHWPADRLVLVKSVDAPPESGMSSGAVDPYFDRLRSRLPAVFWCNLRSSSQQVVRWW